MWQAGLLPALLTELNETVYDQLTHTETIESIGIDRAYRAELEVFAATRKAVRDVQKQIIELDSNVGVTR
jgi:hypothetical protein